MLENSRSQKIAGLLRMNTTLAMRVMDLAKLTIFSIVFGKTSNVKITMVAIIISVWTTKLISSIG